MKVNGTPTRTIWPSADGQSVEIIDQTKLPFVFETVELDTVNEAAHAIYDMLVRGAPLIGATAAYGMALAMKTDPSDANIQRAYKTLFEARPTAVNLRWAIDEMKSTLEPIAPEDRFARAMQRAAEICDEDVAICSAIGDHGKELIQVAYEKAGKSRPVNVLTHCNAGWLATVDWGTAIAPIYKAHDTGIPVHVWVDETRPTDPYARYLNGPQLKGEGVSQDDVDALLSGGSVAEKEKKAHLAPIPSQVGVAKADEAKKPEPSEPPKAMDQSAIDSLFD